MSTKITSIHTFIRCIKNIAPLTLLFSSLVFADESIETIEVLGYKQSNNQMLGSADRFLAEQGVDFSAAGGVSSLPVLNGMMGDRVKVLVDGADITAACGNQMNPPLSYISANQISSYRVIAGISPVSAGGDNIAGVVTVNSISPQFGDNPELSWSSGYVSAQYDTTNNAESYGIGARVANDEFSLNYQGAYEDADSYQDGNGDLVLDSLYQSQNHSLTASFRDEKQQLAIKLSHQKIPFQGFPNQYMDMTDNTSYGVVTQYIRELSAGEFQAQVNFNSVEHEMGFFTDEKSGVMPMNTDSEDISYQLNWRLDLDIDTSLILGQEYYSYRLDDWWPAVEGSMMMGPNDYENINEGERNRLTAFAELQKQLSPQWWISAGVRVEQVTTDTGEVQDYVGTSMGGNYAAAADFNALDREREDNLIDTSLLVTYQASDNDEWQLGLARKNRAPNLYERYSWGVSSMATSMIGWFGDGNGYLGDPDLQAETAHSLSAAYKKTANDDSWQFSANIWYTDVDDYIDAAVVGSFTGMSAGSVERNILQFTNVKAELYGAKMDAKMRIFESESIGLWELQAGLTSTTGEREGGDALYQIMPLNTELSIRQQLGSWQNALTWQWVDSKSDVDLFRLENQTDSYSLLSFSSAATWNKLSAKVEVTNLLDEYYQLPLGGVSVAEYRADTSSGFAQLAGQGRSFRFGVSYSF